MNPSRNWSHAMPRGPDLRVKITEAYATHVARDAYLWAWPLVQHDARLLLDRGKKEPAAFRATRPKTEAIRGMRQHIGFFTCDVVWPSFFYSPVTQGKNVWLLLQLACTVLFGFGVTIAFTDIRRASHLAAASPH